MEKLLYTTKEAAEAIGVSGLTFYRLMHREDHPIPTIKLGNKGKYARRRVSREALEKWIAEETEMSMKGRK